MKIIQKSEGRNGNIRENKTKKGENEIKKNHANIKQRNKNNELRQRK